MRAGLLSRPVVIEEKSVTQDEYGQEEVTWVTWRKLRARVRPISGYQYLQASQQQVEAKVEGRISIRYVPGIDPERMRVRVRTDGADEYYDILAALHVEQRRREIELVVRKQG